MPHAVILLAAGQGSRMRSDQPKVLHPLGGVPILHHALAAAETLAPDRTVVVTGHGAEAVAAAVRARNPDATIVHQAAQNGTAHAVAQAAAALADFSGDALVLFGDTPFISSRTLARITAARAAGADLVVLGFQAADPGSYGRLITTGDQVTAIVEARDASDEERAINLCNSGVMCADARTLFDLAAAVEPVNDQGEYYLTDCVAIAADRGLTTRAVTCDETETLGINTREELAAAEAIFQAGARRAAMAAGATLIDPGSVHLAADTRLGRDVTIEPNVYFGPGVDVGDNVHIKAFSHIEATRIAAGAIIGPFARLRPGTDLGPDTRIGNFVEVKSATVGPGAKINHLTYVGDARIGARSNIGAGTVFCNYDGVFKHVTDVGEDVFIGTHTSLVAPVRVGDGAFTATGSTITKDVPAGDMAVARARQTNKPGLGARLIARLRALKARGETP